MALFFLDILDLTRSWTMPFVASMGLLLLGSLTAFRIRPDQERDTAAPPTRLAFAAH